MAKSEIGKLINNFLKKEINPFLSEHGFKQKTRNFHRVFDDRVEVIGFQGNKWNQGSEGSFTVNLGVYFPQLTTITNGYEPKGLPDAGECQFWERLGILLPEEIDKWWNLNLNVSLENLSAGLKRDIENHALKWIDEHNSFEKIRSKLGIYDMICLYAYEDNLDAAMRLTADFYEQGDIQQKQLAKTWDKEFDFNLGLR